MFLKKIVGKRTTRDPWKVMKTQQILYRMQCRLFATNVPKMTVQGSILEGLGITLESLWAPNGPQRRFFRDKTFDSKKVFAAVSVRGGPLKTNQKLEAGGQQPEGSLDARRQSPEGSNWSRPALKSAVADIYIYSGPKLQSTRVPSQPPWRYYPTRRALGPPDATLMSSPVASPAKSGPNWVQL